MPNWKEIPEIAEIHTVLLHNTEEFDNDLGRRTDENLSLSRFLGIVDGVERIVED